MSVALRRSAGLTLVEVIVSVTIAVALIVSSGILYSTILKTYIKDQIVQDIQRESDSVVNHYSTHLREATAIDQANSNFTNNPNILTVNIPGSLTRKYYVTGNQLHYVDEQGTDVNLLQPGTTVTSLTFVPSTSTIDGQTVLKSIAVSMTLSRTKNSQTTTLSSTTTVGMRPQ